MEQPTSQSWGLMARQPKDASSPPRENRVASSGNPSFAQRKAQKTCLSTPSITVEGCSYNMSRPIDRALLGDTPNRHLSVVQTEANKRRSIYYENEFAVGTERDPDTIADRVRGESLVLAELRTNVIIHDELSTLTDLSYQLSQRYQRPPSSIVINLQHGCCMMFAGSFEPAYTLTISALPSLVQPTTNKRNALLIQTHMQEIIGVAPSRGHLRFIATPEEDVAVGGKTVAGEIDERERLAIKEKILDADFDIKPPKAKRLSLRNSFNFGQATVVSVQPLPTPPGSSDENLPMITTPILENLPPPPEKPPAEKTVKTARRRSFVTSLFSGSKAAAREAKAGGRERRPKTSSGAPN